MRSGLVLAAALVAVGLSACGGGGHVELTVTPASATLDVPMTIRVTGLPSRKTVRLRYSGRSQSGVLWQGSRSVQADAKGVVSLANDYLLAQMHHPGPAPDLNRVSYRATQAAFPQTLLVSVGGATAVVHRRPASYSFATTPERPGKVGFFGNWDRPRDVRQHTAILLFGGSEGGLSGGYQAAALVAHGYPVLDIAYFREPGLPKRLVRIRLEYFEHALRWLAAQPEVDPKRIVTFGVSRGGELSLILGSTFPNLVHGTVGYVPSWAAEQGLASQKVLEQLQKRNEGPPPAWTYRGRPVVGGIPVENTSGPIFVAGGDDDQLWQSGFSVKFIAQEMHQFGRHDVIALDYPHAGHELGVALPIQLYASPVNYGVDHSIYGTLVLGGSPKADEAAREDSWPKLLRFLARI
jgi:dienelactone hydrolase